MANKNRFASVLCRLLGYSKHSSNFYFSFWSLNEVLCSFLAPADCLQYYTAATGSLSTFNWKDTSSTATRQLANQDYFMCFRTEVVNGQVLIKMKSWENIFHSQSFWWRRLQRRCVSLNVRSPAEFRSAFPGRWRTNRKDPWLHRAVTTIWYFLEDSVCQQPIRSIKGTVFVARCSRKWRKM